MVLCCAQLCLTLLQTVVRQALLSMGYSRQEYWSIGIAIFFSRGSSLARDRNQVSGVSYIDRRILYH